MATTADLQCDMRLKEMPRNTHLEEERMSEDKEDWMYHR